jgi:hypothetical protein
MVMMAMITVMMMTTTVGTGLWFKRRVLLGDSSTQTD